MLNEDEALRAQHPLFREWEREETLAEFFGDLDADYDRLAQDE